MPSLGRWLLGRDGAPSGPRRRPIGTVTAALDEDELLVRLAELGEAGLWARALDVAVDDALAGVAALSTLSSALAVRYIERIRHPLKTMSMETAVYVTTRAYVAHLTVEGDPAAYGAPDVPVLGTLPPLRHGRPPQDLLTRVVKATRRGFERVRAVDEDVWQGFVACTTWRVHAAGAGEDAARSGEEAGGGEAGAGEEAGADEDAARAGGEQTYLDPTVVESLSRFGWLLRQVDLHYGLEPERP